MTDRELAYMQWLFDDDTGLSSKTIFAVMTGINYRQSGYVPLDEGDFGRCYRLLTKFPEWLPRLAEVGAAHAQWLPLVQSWTVLTKLYEKKAWYKFRDMLKTLNESGHLLQDEQRRQQGWKVEHGEHCCSHRAPGTF